MKTDSNKKQPIEYRESPKQKATKELPPDLIAKGLRKWLSSDEVNEKITGKNEKKY